jgi:hypothetical protein
VSTTILTTSVIVQDTTHKKRDHSNTPQKHSLIPEEIISLVSIEPVQTYQACHNNMSPSTYTDVDKKSSGYRTLIVKEPKPQTPSKRVKLQALIINAGFGLLFDANWAR